METPSRQIHIHMHRLWLFFFLIQIIFSSMKLLHLLPFVLRSLKLHNHHNTQFTRKRWSKCSCIFNGVCWGNSIEYLTRLSEIISYTLMIHAPSSLYHMMGLCLSEKSFPLSLCSLSVQIHQNTAAAGLRQPCVVRAQSTLRPSETARQTPRFNPIKKPLLSPSIGSLRKAESIKLWTRNQ